MYLDNEQFGIVCENWGKLRKVFGKGMDLSDEGITGRIQAGNEVDGISNQPNITCLKNLEFWMR